ncbi:MAG: glycosyltransferase [Bacteroidales bacterium]|nr:glycosyltransferase [Bacteroidales bacterium]
MTKVLLLIDSLISGGAQRQIVGLAVMLSKEGYDITLLTYHDHSFYLPVLKENNVNYHYERLAKNKFLRFFIIYNYIKEFNPHVVISYLDTPNMLACICHIFNQKFKLIVSERNTTQLLGIKEKLKFYLYKNADKIVPNSYTQTSFIKDNFPMLQSKMVTITNFVDTDLFVPQKCPIKPAGKYLILGVGRVCKQKNVLNFISAINIVREKYDVSVVWYGRTDGEYILKCHELMSELKMDEGAFAFKKQTLNMVPVYQEFDAVCLPSIYEGFPNVLCEAMSCGLPVICSNVCDNPAIVENEKNGFLFDPMDINDIADKIICFIMMNQKDRERMSNRNRKKAIDMFSRQNFLSKYEKLIQEL